MSDIYRTKFWMGTHPLGSKIEIIQDRYFPEGTSKLYLSRVRAANPKIKRLRELIHKHYRFYNDGDSFTIGGYKAKTATYVHRISGTFRIPLTPSELENTNHALHLMEDTIEKLTLQILELTADERRRPMDQYGRRFVTKSSVPDYMNI